MKSDKPTPKKETKTKVYPKYLFRPGERWVHVDKFGYMWEEEIKTND